MTKPLPINTPSEPLYFKEPFVEVKDGYGGMGVLMTNKKHTHVQCHICGKFYQALACHLRVHKLTAPEYKTKFGFTQRAALCSDKVRAERINAYEQTFMNPEYLARKKESTLKYWEKVKAGKAIAVRNGHRKTIERRNLNDTCPAQLIEKIQKLAQELGHSPSTREFERAYTHSTAPIKVVFGTWNKAVRIAGLSPFVQKKQVTQKQLLAMMVDLYKRTGRSPRSSDFNREVLPDMRTLRYYFYTINEAREAAGLPTVERVGAHEYADLERLS